jgi:hypothetical protein
MAMATIDDLVLTVSRDSHAQVAVQVTYTPGYTSSEWATGVQWDWRVQLVRLVGEHDPAEAVVSGVFKPEGEASDVVIATLASEVDIHAPTLTPTVLPPTTITHVLSTPELDRLRVLGREHVYVLVSARPMAINPAFAYAAVDIDVGDPGE